MKSDHTSLSYAFTKDLTYVIVVVDDPEQVMTSGGSSLTLVFNLTKGNDIYRRFNIEISSIVSMPLCLILVVLWGFKLVFTPQVWRYSRGLYH